MAVELNTCFRSVQSTHVCGTSSLSPKLRSLGMLFRASLISSQIQTLQKAPFISGQYNGVVDHGPSFFQHKEMDKILSCQSRPSFEILLTVPKTAWIHSLEAIWYISIVYQYKKKLINGNEVLEGSKTFLILCAIDSGTCIADKNETWYRGEANLRCCP